MVSGDDVLTLAAGVKGCEEVVEAATDVLKARDSLVTAGDASAVASYLLLSGFEFKAFLLDKEVNHAYGINVLRGVEACAVPVAVRLDDSELGFPKAKSRSRDV